MFASLSTRCFRNLEPLSWELSPGSHLLYGENGSGKTSLLEAIYVLCTTRSFRSARLADCRRLGADSFDLKGEAGPSGRVRIEVSWSQGERRRAVNGSTGSLTEHLSMQPLVAWTAVEAEAMKGEPKLRRRLLDRGVVSLRPAALEVLSRYSRVLAEKRVALLKGLSDLPIWNALLAEVASTLIQRRHEYFKLLERAFAEQIAASGLDLPQVDLQYRSSPLPAEEATAESILAALERSEQAERQRKTALLGPHRDDLVLKLRGREVRQIASAGERRALGMLLAAAHGQVLAEAGLEPVYLLDDADAELSRRTLAALWGIFSGRSQVLVTSSRPAAWEGLPLLHRWFINGGRLAPA